MADSWRAFELLVARVERAIAPLGAKLMSPDHLVDTVTGETREVDASIRPSVSGPVARVLECRDRSKVADVTWIEQLVTKCRDLGVVATAISSTGFSGPATKKAQHYGIDVRQITEIDQAEMVGWAKIAAVEHLIHFQELRSVNFEFYAESGDETANLHADVVRELTACNGNAAVLVRTTDGRRLRPTDVLDEALRKQAAHFLGTPTDGPRVARQVILRFPRHTLWIATDLGPRDIGKLILGVDFRVETQGVSLPGQGFRYHGTGGPPVNGVEASAQVLGSTVFTSFHREENSDTLHIAVDRSGGA